MNKINYADVVKFYRKGEVNKLISICEKSISSFPNDINNYWYLSSAYLLNNQIDMAQSIWMSVLWESDDIDKTTQELVDFIHKLARELVISNYYQEAKLFYEQLITLDEDNLLNYKCLLDLNLQINSQEEAEIIFKHLINSNYSDHAIYLEYAQFLAKQYRHEELFLILKQGVEKFPFEQNLYLAMVQFLKNNGRAKEAIAFAEQGLKLNPDNIIFQLENAKILPIIYESEEEIEFYRKRFTEHLDNIFQNLCLKNEMEKKNALTAISLSTNFYLQYQGKNDLKIQKKYGDLVEKITKANYPTTSKYTVNNDNKRRIKIGIISCHFRNHNGANWALGWIKSLDKNKFIINCYYLEVTEDYITKEFIKYSDNFYFCSSDLNTTIETINKDQLNVVIYTDIGMKPITNILASIRLVSIQCVTFGHPITSGLSTIDYYISRELMETENSKNYYTEKLILLPNNGFYLEDINLPKKITNREAFGFDHNSILYLSTQSLFKYLPQFDYIYPEIATQIPLAKFIFIEFPISKYVNHIFRKRLKKAFVKYHLNYHDYCIILPRLNEEKFMSLHMVGDIFLDTFTWSADNTCRLAVSCDLPIVTCPGEFMRSRHSYGILKMIDMEETITYSEKEYIEMAIKLGNNLQWRQNIIDKMKKNKHKLFYDLDCIQGLEKFLTNVVVNKI
ncbi:O-linked N-acetylglucosamine transferase, SPINDLY family protein [Cyanobacterium aponinum]|uniref:Tetratricopeptide TPR_2 repeat protein n=1 Tax=Cyanobacterium aponinum (strain PCC 10605) TaxID=755178 RepID=K9Z3K9_CYAAP|nr:hypothetical protein [Cyanobacterium aponinum]AFZ53327.1 tetratricopeptide TPR_2 repeat protein [Cyanobacterium aponinum PCC 10605]